MTKKTCPLGEDCDLTIAWMAGRESAKNELQAEIDALEAKLGKAVWALQEASRLAYQPHYGDRGDALDHCFDAIDVLRATFAELAGGEDD